MGQSVQRDNFLSQYAMSELKPHSNFNMSNSNYRIHLGGGGFKFNEV